MHPDSTATPSAVYIPRRLSAQARSRTLAPILVALGLLASGCVRPKPILAGAEAAPPPPSLAGTWVLRAADEIRPDGTRVNSYGSEPQGILFIDGDGRYSLQIFRQERPKFASGDKRRGRPEEYEAAVLGMSSHIGTVGFDPKTGDLSFRIALASFPNWDATEQIRKFQLSGDELSYQIPGSASGNGTIPISVWRRVRSHR